MPLTPPSNTRNLQALVQIMEDLRNPDQGCPWDVEQTHQSIARYCIEEAYEVVDAIERDDDQDMRDELGDLLLQVVFHAQLGKERGAFGLADICEAVCEKMIRRHPHVYQQADDRDAEGQTIAWEQIKADERAAKGPQSASVLADVPTALPALTRAEKLGKRAAAQGFDWPELKGVTDKIREELAEVEAAAENETREALEEELGDLLFSIANLTRFFKADGETLLRRANAKFIGRFEGVERAVKASGRPFSDHSLGELEAYWTAVKVNEPSKG